MPYTFRTDARVNKKKQEQERRRAERERRARERKAYEDAQRAREEAFRARQNARYANQQAIAAVDRQVALEIINAGYRTLSRKHHPDLGGTHEQMVAINRVCDRLRQIVG